MIFWVIGIGIFLILLERLIPDQKLPEVKGWWVRVVIINFLQLGVIWLGSVSWDKWFDGARILDLEKIMHPAVSGFVAYFVITFVFYWWHRWRHTVNFLWLAFHQVHHSPARIETITSFYKHPLEIIVNSLIIGSVNHIVLGIGIEASGFTLLYSGLGEYFYHMNIKTPYWVGFIFQRPEMHRIHHEQNKHYKNFSDFPFWDMLFGTFENPKVRERICGFKPKREYKLGSMLLFKNVNNPLPNKKK